MYKKGAGNDKQGKDAGNRTLCPYRNFSQAINSFTHQNKKSRSRIDRIYVTDKESGKIMRQGFIDTPWRDHKIITVEMNETSEKGPGQWALNTDLLKGSKILRRS